MATYVVKTSQVGTTILPSSFGVEATHEDAPGGFIFCTPVDGVLPPNFTPYWFVWIARDGSSPQLRAIAVGPVTTPVTYDPGSGELTFTDFDPANDGTLIGPP